MEIRLYYKGPDKRERRDKPAANREEYLVIVKFPNLIYNIFIMPYAEGVSVSGDSREHIKLINASRRDAIYINLLKVKTDRKRR